MRWAQMQRRSSGANTPPPHRRLLTSRGLTWLLLLSSAAYSITYLTSVDGQFTIGAIWLGRGRADIAADAADAEPTLSDDELQADLAAAKRLLALWPSGKPKGAFFILTRNRDLGGQSAGKKDCTVRECGQPP